jgi:eukaryotic-like serine/threonine-protein kinase
MGARRVLGVFSMGCGLLFGCGLATWVVLWVSLRSSAVRVPDLGGMEISRASAALQDMGLVARMQEGVFNPKIGVGHVAAQRPGAGIELKRGAAVLLYPSLGKAVQTVGDLTGMPLSLATSELENEGLQMDTVCEVQGEAGGVVVLAHTPGAGAQVAPGSAVALLVNRVPAQRRWVMPDFVGLAENDATRVLRALGFQLATVQRVPYPGTGSGVVLRQNPAAGQPVVDAAVIGLWVSR